MIMQNILNYFLSQAQRAVRAVGTTVSRLTTPVSTTSPVLGAVADFTPYGAKSPSAALDCYATRR